MASIQGLESSCFTLAKAGPGAPGGEEEGVDGVEGERDEDEGPLEHADEGQGVEELDLLGVGEGAVDGLVVGADVLDEEGADGDDVVEGMVIQPEEGVALAGAESVY